MRQGIVYGKADEIESIRRYLPTNYGAFTWSDDVIIVGQDSGGWTMEDYVVPRLNSGLYSVQIQF